MALNLFCCRGNALTPAAFCTYHYEQALIQYKGTTITVEYYIPDRYKSYPLVFMLHGSAGAFTLASSHEPSVDNFGEKSLARSCFAVVFPHYFEALGYKSMTSQQEMSARFADLLSVVDFLLSDAEARSWAKKRPVFLFGESLGGYLSVALAFQRSEVSRVSEVSGGLPNGYFLRSVGSLSILISHGIEDTLVPVAESESLRQYCLSRNIPVEMDLYPEVGHYFPKSVSTRSISRTIEFFNKQSSR